MKNVLGFYKSKLFNNKPEYIIMEQHYFLFNFLKLIV